MNELKLPSEIIQDGVRISPREISECAKTFSDLILRKRTRRLAVASSRVDLVVAALAACHTQGCELLLLRHETPTDSPVWHEWNVDGLFQPDGTIASVGAIASPHTRKPVESEGFALLLATSGTTGKPRIASHSMERLVGRIREPKAGSHSASWLLTYHPASFAGMQVLLSCLAGGSTLVAFSKWTVAQMCAAARDYSVSHVSATPTFWRAFVMALHGDASQLALRHITLGGEAADQAILTRLRGLFPNAVIMHIYASTEAGALFAVRDGRAGFPAEWLETGVDGVGLRLRNGILEVRSPRAMRGYLNSHGRPTHTDDGWLITNDLVDIKGDRALFKGRADLVINVGGFNVSPEEVEAALLEHPSVVEVVVCGAPNSMTGATVVAYVRPVPGADEAALRQALVQVARSRLEPYKVPRVFRFARKIDITDAGKKSRRV